MRVTSYLKSTLFVIIFTTSCLYPNGAPEPLHNVKAFLDKIVGSIMGGCIGDALGKPTEFIKDIRVIFKTYPGGIRCFNDLEKFRLLEISATGIPYAPYTDDTAMARVTLQVLLHARQHSLDLNDAMILLVRAYIADMDNPQGWTKKGRAPGMCCLKNIRKLQRITCMHTFTFLDSHWWQAGGPEDGGCGSVMRAHVFGLVFADNPEKAALWAAEHSKITHGAPLALASCAAMAIGTAYAVQGKDPEFIIDAMIRAAQVYDAKTADMIQDATQQALVLRKQAHGRPTLSYNFDVSKPIFAQYLGWAAHDAIAAAAYIFALVPNDILQAWFLGVHTPGDSDSIASMAGALVGARVGYAKLKATEPHYMNYEDAVSLEQYGDRATRLIFAKN